MLPVDADRRTVLAVADCSRPFEGETGEGARTHLGAGTIAAGGAAVQADHGKRQGHRAGFG